MSWALIVTIVLIGLTTWALVKPHFVYSQAAFEANEVKQDLLNKKARLVSLLRDLELDRKTGKIEKQDYERVRAALCLQLAKVLKDLDSI